MRGLGGRSSQGRHSTSDENEELGKHIGDGLDDPGRLGASRR
jgi:hypothetical protein